MSVNERDALATLLADHYEDLDRAACSCGVSPESDHETHQAEVVLTAGFRRRHDPTVVETVEALRGLPYGTVLPTNRGQTIPARTLIAAGDQEPAHYGLHLPATVVSATGPTDAQVEDAAKAGFYHVDAQRRNAGTYGKWEDQNEDYRDYLRGIHRASLRAALEATP